MFPCGETDWSFDLGSLPMFLSSCTEEFLSESADVVRDLTVDACVNVILVLEDILHELSVLLSFLCCQTGLSSVVVLKSHLVLLGFVFF